MRYGVKYQRFSNEIAAGTVRHDPSTDRDVFITHDDVTNQAIGAVALWLVAHDGPYQISTRQGTVYELCARVVDGDSR